MIASMVEIVGVRGVMVPHFVVCRVSRGQSCAVVLAVSRGKSWSVEIIPMVVVVL